MEQTRPNTPGHLDHLALHSEGSHQLITGTDVVGFVTRELYKFSFESET
jgi:hypothetical protein